MGSAGEPTQVEAWFWKPQETLIEHSQRDFGSGNRRYEEWVASGIIEATPGRAIDPGAVALRIAELSKRYRVIGLAFDPWRINDLLREFDRIGLQAYQDGEKGTGLRLVAWGQGMKPMAPAIDALERAVMERTLIHGNNPLLNNHMANAVARTDSSGNRKIDKSATRFRIDGAVALAMLMGLQSRDRTAPPLDVSTLIF